MEQAGKELVFNYSSVWIREHSNVCLKTDTARSLPQIYSGEIWKEFLFHKSTTLADSMATLWR